MYMHKHIFMAKWEQAAQGSLRVTFPGSAPKLCTSAIWGCSLVDVTLLG